MQSTFDSFFKIHHPINYKMTKTTLYMFDTIIFASKQFHSQIVIKLITYIIYNYNYDYFRGKLK